MAVIIHDDEMEDGARNGDEDDDEDNHWEAQPTCELAMKEEEDPRNPSPQALNLAHMVAQNYNELPAYGIKQATEPMYIYHLSATGPAILSYHIQN